MEILNFDGQMESKEKGGLLTYHHARPLEAVVYGAVKQENLMEYASDEEDLEIRGYSHEAYKFLEEQVGFYPLFLAVGRRTDDVRMTGYQGQWARILTQSKFETTYRKKGEYPNDVLFSFNEMPAGSVFTDYGEWANTMYLKDEEKKKHIRSTFKPSWIKNDWMALANKKPHSVQILVPELDLRKAAAVFARNKEAKKALEELGFKNVSVGRVTNIPRK